MGIKAGNLVIKGQGPVVQESSPVGRVSTERLPETTVENIKEPSVVVDGKVKKIGKKSAFLLDMLTLDD